MDQRVVSRSLVVEELGEQSFRMIDVGAKPVTQRRAVAEGQIRMAPQTLQRVFDRTVPKGDVLSLAEVAGILAAKKTSDILPLCHPLSLDAVRVRCDVSFDLGAVRVICEVSTSAKTGVEMEALVGVNAALLCIYDLVKAIDPVLSIENVFLREKLGGKSGHWRSPLLHEKEVKHSNLGESLREVKGAVVTVSDRCFRGETVDESGDEIVKILVAQGCSVSCRESVPDEIPAIRESITRLSLSDCQVLVLTGGTGLGPRDVTPEALAPLWDKKFDGFGELLRSSGSIHSRHAWLSRSGGGLIGNCLVLMLPGSPKAVRQGLEVLIPLIPHAISIARGGKH